MAIFIYVIYSWWCWWYGGSLGSRAAIESFGILAIFLATFLQFVTKRLDSKWKIAVLIFPVLFSVYLTMFQSIKAKGSILHWDAMTYKAYWDLFPNKKASKDYVDLLLTPDYKNAKKFGREFIDIKYLSESENVSNAVVISNDVYQEIDTLLIKCNIWDNHKFLGNIEYVKLLICSEGDNSCDTLKIQPKKRTRFWNEIEIQYPIAEDMKKET